ncbi:hypothetical protein ACK8N7_11680 [Streptomyces griseobrunneus]|uniref:hypothetical protein n=1 Tax=Streptomyces microflavus TaxID=1919 RepID=UPI00381714D0
MKVLQVLDPSQGIVRFRCESGVVSGRWMGRDPAHLEKFDVEIEVPEEVAEWALVSAGVTSLSEVAGVAPAALIVGSVVRFDDGDDSVVEIRVGSDILLIEITNRRSELLVESLISFRAPEVQLYPYDL